MDRLIYERDMMDEDNKLMSGEPFKIVFEISSGMKIKDFKTICKRLASSMGYSGESIEETFGTELDAEEEKELKIHIHDLVHQ